MERLLGVALILVALGAVPVAEAEVLPSATTQIVMLGTGTPNPEPQRSGPAVAIVVNDTPYLVDFGPGVVRRAAALSPRYGGNVKGLDVRLIKRAFLTHLHADHTLGLPDLILTPWIIGRNEPLQVYGPAGIVEMTKHLLAAYSDDIQLRISGAEAANDQGWRVVAQAIEEGVVYQDANVKVEAFNVQHGAWPEAFGYRFTTPDRVIVISGDATPDWNLEEYGRDVDVLIHEVYSATGLSGSPPSWQRYMRDSHTSGLELGEIAHRVKPGLLVLTHVLLMGASEEELIEEVRTKFRGDVKLANDLDVF